MADWRAVVAQARRTQAKASQPRTRRARIGSGSARAAPGRISSDLNAVGSRAIASARLLSCLPLKVSAKAKRSLALATQHALAHRRPRRTSRVPGELGAPQGRPGRCLGAAVGENVPSSVGGSLCEPDRARGNVRGLQPRARKTVGTLCSARRLSIRSLEHTLTLARDWTIQLCWSAIGREPFPYVTYTLGV